MSASPKHKTLRLLHQTPRVDNEDVEKQSDMWRDAGNDAYFRLKKKRGTWMSRTWHFSLTFTLILLIGIVSTIWVSGLDSCIKFIFDLRGKISCIPGDEIECGDDSSSCACSDVYFSNTNEFLRRWLVFTIWCTVLGVSGYLVTSTHGHVASGSGIPRLKSVLSGTQIHHFLSLRVLLVKSVSVILISSSGLPIGREGPFVHLAACIAKLLMRLPVYRQRYGSSSSRRIDMISIASAAGISAAFGSPFGGIIFSVEIMSSYFIAEENLPRRFLAAFSGFFVIKMLHPTGYFSFLEIQTGEIRMTWTAAAVCICVGVICGVLSGIYVRFVSSLVRMRVNWSRTHKKSFHYMTVATVVVLILHSTAMFGIYQFLPEVRTQRALIAKMFSSATIADTQSLVLTVLFWIPISIVSVALPIPFGVFMPSLVSGSLIGRIISESIKMKFPYIVADFHPGMFALVGAASYAGGLTRAVSSCVIVAETQPHLLVPVAIGVLSSYFVANRISNPVYEAIIESDAYLSMSDKLNYETGTQTVGSIMKPVSTDHVLEAKSTILEAQQLLELSGSQMFPVVRVENNSLYMIGEVQRRDLLIAVERVSDRIRNNIDDDDDFLDEEQALLRRRRRGNGRPRNQSLLDESLPYTFADGTSSLYFPTKSNSDLDFQVTVDLCPISVSSHTTIHKVRVLFRTLRLTTLYIHDDSNRLIGSISRSRFIHAIRTMR